MPKLSDYKMFTFKTFRLTLTDWPAELLETDFTGS